MNLTNLIDHPELLNKETLYLLRQEVASHPYFQAARLLYLQNLFLLRDPSFGEELRRTALYLPDRSVLYDMIVKPAQLQDSNLGEKAKQGNADDGKEPDVKQQARDKSRKHRRDILDSFIENSGDRIELHEVSPETQAYANENGEEPEEDIFTETLARIYTKQGRYDKAAQIIRRIYLNNPKKSVYFADQLRFLEKLRAIQTPQN